MTGKRPYLPQYTNAAVFEVEGARVGLITCLACGVAILVDPRDTFDPTERHNDWHRQKGSS